MAVLSAHEKEVLEGSHGTNPAAVYQPKKPGRAISESVRRMILRQSFIKRLNHRNQQDAKPDVGLGMLAAMSRISRMYARGEFGFLCAFPP